MKIKKAVAASALAGTMALGGVAAAAPAAAHDGAHGVVAEHGGSGFTQYQEIVLGKGTTHWLAWAPTDQVVKYFVRMAATRPQFRSAAVGGAAYAASAKIRIEQAEREGVCFSIVKVPYTWTYWPAKTSVGCR